MSKTQEEFEEIVDDVVSAHSYFFDGYSVGDFSVTLNVWYRRRDKTYKMYIDFEEDGSSYSTHNPFGATAPEIVAHEICRKLQR